VAVSSSPLYVCTHYEYRVIDPDWESRNEDSVNDMGTRSENNESYANLPLQNRAS
jgi:hypothetical protein